MVNDFDLIFIVQAPNNRIRTVERKKMSTRISGEMVRILKIPEDAMA